MTKIVLASAIIAALWVIDDAMIEQCTARRVPVMDLTPDEIGIEIASAGIVCGMAQRLDGKSYEWEAICWSDQ